VLSDRAPSVPDLRSNRYAQIATPGCGRCADKFDLPYTTTRRWASICRVIDRDDDVCIGKPCAAADPVELSV
jgi:hypothetical protein